jgi:hypothetical protein
VIEPYDRYLEDHPALPTKACCTVLDFIGQQRREFRFDLRLRALTGTSRGALERQIQEGFPYLPTGCNLSLDRQAAAIVLDNVRQALHLRKPELVRELQQLAATDGEPTLRRFLEHTGAELADLSRQSIGGWVGLRRLAGLPTPKPGPDEERLARAIWRWLHVSDEERIGFCRAVTDRTASMRVADRRAERLAAMLARLAVDGRCRSSAVDRGGTSPAESAPGALPGAARGRRRARRAG